MRLVIVTGLSGAGKSTALRALEDIAFYCVDNLPLPLLPQLAELLASRGIDDAAVSVDARQHWFLPAYRETVNALRGGGHHVEGLFLAAKDEVLLRRYSETRRRHPLSGDQLSDGIHRDHLLLGEMRDDAAVVIDTENLNVHELRALIQARFARATDTMAVTFQSFGYKHGLPADADLVFDIRFLPNPYFVPALSPLDGREREVAAYVLGTTQGQETAAELERFLRFSLPNFRREGKQYLTVAIGCTGGRHRSVAMVEELRHRLGDEWDVVVRHRDLGRSDPTRRSWAARRAGDLGGAVPSVAPGAITTPTAATTVVPAIGAARGGRAHRETRRIGEDELLAGAPEVGDEAGLVGVGGPPPRKPGRP